MSKEITIKELRNGYVYEIKGNTRNNGEFICKNTEEFLMLEVIGEALLGFRVKVERR